MRIAMMTVVACLGAGAATIDPRKQCDESVAKDVDLVDRVRSDLARPVLENGEDLAWKVALAEVTRLDLAADARWRACGGVSEAKAVQSEMRAKMTAAVGGFPERSPMNANVTETIRCGGYRIEKVYFESQPKFYVTGLFYRPDGEGPFPSVAIACGHSGNGKGAKDYQRACVQLVKAGIAAFIYDPVDQGERTQLPGSCGNVHGHNRIGIRAALLGWSMVRFRAWDAMRAVDYLTSREDVVADRIGFMGNSGGGTLTALTMALDGRIRAAAPSCYLSTIRHVCEDCGPQDAEQNIFGQLAFGLNHLGYVAMRAPLATLMVCKEKDFFPIRGSRATREIAKGVYALFGSDETYSMFVAPGGHGWEESTRTASVAWMRRWLNDETEAFGKDQFAKFIALDVGFDLKSVDCGLNPGFEVSPDGNVRNLPGAVTAYDILRQEAERQASSRPMTVTAETVRKVAGLRSASELGEIRSMKGVVVKHDGYSATAWNFDMGDGMTLTATELRPNWHIGGPPVLILPSEGRKQAAAKAVEFLAGGHAVLVADLRGFGETGRKGHRFYQSDYPEEGIAAMAYLTGRNLVSLRAEDATRVARFWANTCGNQKVVAVSIGRTAIPLAHAAAVYGAVFDRREYLEKPPAWHDWFQDDAVTVHYADLVNGAYGTYDWSEL